MDNIIDFDPHTHQLDSKETKGLFYFFNYVKKNLYLFTAIDALPGDYEDEIKYIFEKFHQRTQRSAMSNYHQLDIFV